MKKFLSLLLSLCLLLGTLPLQVSAFAGDIFPSEGAVKTVTLEDGSLSLQNEYIHMTFRKLWGTYAYLTVAPAAKPEEESILIGQTPRCTFITYDQGREKTEGVVTEPIKAEFVTKTPNGSANAIKVEYSLLTSLSLIKAKATVYYELVQLKETGASSDTWGVLASVSEICIDEDSMPQDWNRDFNFKWGYSFNCFTATGHTSTLEKPGGPAIKMSRTTVPEGENPQITTENSVFTASVEDLSTKTVPKGYSEWGDVDGVYTTEVYTDGYPWANPFVGLSDYYEKDITSVRGKPIRVALAQTVSVTPGDKPLNTWVQCDSYTGFTFEEPNGSEEYSHFLWGFHDLIKAGTENVPSWPDTVNTAINAKRLAAFAVNGGVTVEYVADDAALQALKKQYGEPVALISGDYESKNGTEFTFTGGAAMLSPSVTATWNKNSGKLVIKKDGTIEHSGVSLNAPSFKFYQPKNGAENELQISLTKDGFAFQIDPEKNDAIVFVDIPYAAVKLENAKADAAGNLVFSGNIGFRTIFNGAEFSMEKLGYGLNTKNEFKVNGVKATGSFDTAKLMALELASISGEVNTFKGEERYAFELELNAFDLFETEASLALERSKKDGSLIPDELWFFVKSSPGIPLVPPVPVGQLNGGGAGFKDLAKTVNGDYFAIPPIKLRGALAGTYMHLIEGTGNVVLGPSEISLKATDVGIVGLGKNAQFIDSFGYSLQLNGQERTYKGVTYKGTYFGGSEELAINLPSKTLDIFYINTAIKLGAFGGANQNKDTVYLGIGANGIVKGRLQIPSSLGIPFLSGLSLPSTDINLIVGGQTTFPVTSTNVSEGMKQAFKNVDVYLGAMTGVNAGVFDARVWVLVPQIVQTDFRKGGGWDIETKWLGKLPEWDWSTKGVDPLVQAVAAEDSGEAVPMLLAADPYAAENGGTNTQIIDVNANPGETPYILLAFENTVTEQQIKEALTIKKNDQDIAINWVGDGGQRDPNSAINADTDILKNKNDEQEYRMAMLRLSEGGTYEVNTNSLTLVTDKSCGVAITPFESLVLNLNDYQLSGEIKYAETGTEYVLRTYLANAEGGADYLVEEQIVADPENIAVNIPESGTLAPTGEYYVTSFLMTEKETDLDGDGVMEKALAAIDSDQFNSKISYTNTKQPESPAHVNLEAAGNEVMRAEWQQVDNADGYRVTIYQQQNGGWVDTGFGYDLNKETTSIDMALTVGGEETAESKNLSANETYKVGVSAYTQTEDGAKYYSAETESSGVFLPEYTPLNLALSVNGTACAPDENGVYHAYVGGGSNTLTVTCAEADSITVTRMDTDVALTPDGSNSFAIPDFTGTLMLRVNGVKGKDVTGVFLLVSRDTTAPVLTLSAPVFYADRAAGSYQITGTADAGSKILCGENNESVYAAGDGSFAIQGTLEERQDGDALYIRAQDSAGNLSARQLALVARQTETYAVTVTTDGNGTASADLAAAAAGTNISLNATPNTGYHFKEWQVVSGGVTIENDKFIMPDGDVEIKAIFEKDAAPATPVPTAPAKPESSPTPAPAAPAKPESSPTPAPAAPAKPESSPTPAPAATAKPNSSPTTAPAAAAKPNSSPTPAPAATAKPESSPALAPTATAKPDSSPTPAPTAPATKLPVWWVALPIVGGVALAGVFVMRKKKRRR
ncbi:InlB B-repeat-containing protein [Gemmiger formicilis]|uniref:InlB B-repeat-containing protein n=1 Tax=Gemmiger formicilis TaxID=745368 RepID=UPI003996A653